MELRRVSAIEAAEGTMKCNKTLQVTTLETIKNHKTGTSQPPPKSKPGPREARNIGPASLGRLRRADWTGDPHFDEDCYPLIYRHTGGVPRQINTLCSRLLLFGFLEKLHALTASSVEKVAGDLREEIAVVTAPSAPADPVGGSESIAQISQRLGLLEESVHKQGLVIKRALEIAAHYFREERA